MTVFLRFSAFLAISLVPMTAPKAQDVPSFGLPIDCVLGKDCFLQQMPDMDEGPDTSDPYCGSATYDGHKGTDIRLRYYEDIKNNIPVVASRAGTILRLRDGVADKLVRSEADRDRVRDLECGNGVVVDHEGGWQSQYCHLKKGSISVIEGQVVKAGDILGSVGSSGFAQFAHVHLAITKDGQHIDPFTAKPLGETCHSTGPTANLWQSDALIKLGQQPTQILDMGTAGGVVDHENLDLKKPASATTDSAALVAWVSLINLKMGDILTLKIIAPDGAVFASNKVDPLDRAKAIYSFFGGRKGASMPGKYQVTVEVIRENAALLSESRVFQVE